MDTPDARPLAMAKRLHHRPGRDPRAPRPHLSYRRARRGPAHPPAGNGALIPARKPGRTAPARTPRRRSPPTRPPRPPRPGKCGTPLHFGGDLGVWREPACCWNARLLAGRCQQLEPRAGRMQRDPGLSAWRLRASCGRAQKFCRGGSLPAVSLCLWWSGVSARGGSPPEWARTEVLQGCATLRRRAYRLKPAG
jgi:hypothetical protein